MGCERDVARGGSLGGGDGRCELAVKCPLPAQQPAGSQSGSQGTRRSLLIETDLPEKPPNLRRVPGGRHKTFRYKPDSGSREL